jgi:chitin disaccharide deacetylase
VKALIVTADDFGVSLPVNEAVENAHTQGILSAASLMTGAPAFDDAVARARRLPTLGTGIHLTLVDGTPVLPAGQIPGLTGPDGRFLNDPVRFGFNMYFSPTLRRQAEAEIRAQFERFRATGLSMDHINGHQHFHIHPVIARIIADIAPSFGSPPVRIPYEPFGPSYRAVPERGRERLWNMLFFGAQTLALRRRMKRAGIQVNDIVFGINDSGAMTEDRVLAYLEALPAGVTELYGHPATGRWPGADNIPAHYRLEDEYRALISPAVVAKLKALNIRPVSFRAAFA